MQFFYKIFLIALCLTAAVFSHSAQSNGLPVAKNFTTEANEARQKKVPILVLFMSDSCHYCEIVLEDFLIPMQRDPAFKNKVIFRQIETSSDKKLIDFEGKLTSYRDFSRKNKVWGVPHIILFDSHGKELSSVIGLLTVDYYYAYLDTAINEALQKVKAEAK